MAADPLLHRFFRPWRQGLARATRDDDRHNRPSSTLRNLLFLSHRFPYPPDRGEKIRSWHLINHLAQSYRVFLGCLVDDQRDWEHRPKLAAVCAGLGCFGIDKRRQKLSALAKIRPGRPLMLDYYGHPGLHRWVEQVTAREAMDVVYVFSTAMAPYADAAAAPRRILDMQDVDSEKWAAYARQSGWPTSLVWGREARTLGAYERAATMTYDQTLLVTEEECRSFTALAPETVGRVTALENGVDLAFFAPAVPGRYPNPYTGAGPWLALVGNMDYWPNADAAAWFARHALPELRARHPAAPPCLAVVGANPGPDVLGLADLPGVLVTGRVPDVRPYVAHAAAVVAPLRIARGVQNKVLEGMAMARPVVASPAAFAGIRAQAGRDVLVADGAAAMVRVIGEVLDGQHDAAGPAGRRAVELAYAWPAQMARLDAILAGKTVPQLASAECV